MKDLFTNKELRDIDDMENDLIIMLFDSKDKRHTIRDIIKRAYIMGRDNRKV